MKKVNINGGSVFEIFYNEEYYTKNNNTNFFYKLRSLPLRGHDELDNIKNRYITRTQNLVQKLEVNRRSEESKSGKSFGNDRI